MNKIERSARYGLARLFGQGLANKISILGVGVCLALSPAAANAAGSAPLKQKEYLGWLAYLSGSGQVSDLAAWAQAQGMNPNGGWQQANALSKGVLAQTLVQFLNLNPQKYGGDYVRILLREGIVLPDSDVITRKDLVKLLDQMTVRNRLALMSSHSGSPMKGNNGLGNGEDPPPPGWLNPRNPHYGKPQNDGPGNYPGNPGNKGGWK